MRVAGKSQAGSTPTVAIIGGGMGGIAMGVKLKKAGITSFTIFEKDAGPGGTWWTNTYPGCEVDIVSSIYSFSFNSRNWSRNYARQPELMEYINDTVDRWGLRSHYVFNTRVTRVEWQDETLEYALTFEDGSKACYQVVVSAVGLLSDPQIPYVDGLSDFTGRWFHSAHWDHDLDLAGKRVVIVGTGSTAAQIIPAIAPLVKQLDVYQREPGWVLPKGDRDYTEKELTLFSVRLVREFLRFRYFARSQLAHVGKEIYRLGSKRNIEGRERALAYIDKVFEEREDLKEAVTPRYAFSGKRRVVSSDYYPALLRDNVGLVPYALQKVTSDSVIDANGVSRKADVIIFATGFHAAQFLSSLEVSGRQGRDLHEVWRDGAFAFLGMAVPGFPNLYMLYGPNTNGGAPITFNHERQADYVVANIKQMISQKVPALEVKKSYSDYFNVWIQQRLRGTAWAVSNNYMKSESGRIVTQWPESAIQYWAMLRLFRRGATTQLSPET